MRAGSLRLDFSSLTRIHERINLMDAWDFIVAFLLPGRQSRLILSSLYVSSSIPNQHGCPWDVSSKSMPPTRIPLFSAQVYPKVSHPSLLRSITCYKDKKLLAVPKVKPKPPSYS